MPLYEFQCQEEGCKYYFEVVCSSSDRDNPKECENCGSLNTVKVINAPTYVVNNYMYPPEVK